MYAWQAMKMAEHKAKILHQVYFDPLEQINLINNLLIVCYNVNNKIWKTIVTYSLPF